ncbi:DUF1822 family protein [Leptodesmis sichuanensis]|uniref:DUF1822 family protein n=1 Tax=Leptodesmis sichuanensis TaxID=2906798 RepID=UPI001F2143D5|nr:DUF1822 family protein [Leptodesmis sichuanensis]UIE38127.1 DUF1822 family protein [Leptodesmis sichuanensis A121]
MTGTNHSQKFTAPLGASAHAQAEQFCQQQTDPEKVRQVYLNTLAVYAVKFYLSCMGLETEPKATASHDYVMQTLMDVADLIISGVGTVECRPVLPGASTMQIPPEVWSDRIGYIAVQLDPTLSTATLLGFTPKAGTGEVLLNCLRSLDEFLVHIRQFQVDVPLHQWLHNFFSAGWQTLEELIRTPQPLALSFRSESSLPESTVKRAKLLNLGLQLGQRSVALLVAVAPKSEATLEISVQLHPVAGEPYLPPELELKLLSSTGDILQEVRSRPQDNYIQLKRFWGHTGEQFAIQVGMGEVRITETFVV